ncbi:unnamed protein product [Kluyveromyces dobzhanskii CBS 2104]|uniref:Chitin synthase export chaperone n=1 Tax=Kluyveromyces dobzhanskii CBS 2104 TaxID=1427455 RepID=A0A0A8L3J4_9SACH|nr:unnamed protein product [Kluyveromyces dobzhanskii CBS 2104]
MVFGDFSTICQRTPLPLCSVVKSAKQMLLTNDTVIQNSSADIIDLGILPVCYARSIDVANTMIFEIGNAFINILAFFLLMFIIYNVRRKVTAIGRSEYSYFFQTFLVLIVFTLVVDCGVSAPGSSAYPFLVSVQLGLAGACCWMLSVLGLLGFRLWEDGTFKSMLLVYGMSFIGFVLNFVVSIVTFKEWIQRKTDMSTDTVGLFTVMFVINALALLIYIVCLLVVSVSVLENYWATGAILLGVFFFVAGQVLVYAFSNKICEGVSHYLDGLFFGSLCNLFAIMMLYKNWDMSTDDDLEFSVSIETNNYTTFNPDVKF